MPPYNEGQILYFLREILPVLTYIHDRDPIHRDISPDNVICRFTDQKPVLIDFGLVKDVSSKYTQMAFTPAGKPWFSPHEQLRGDSISPSSDLYALGVTVLWLMTGKDSKDLYTPRTGAWEFRQYVNIIDDRLKAAKVSYDVVNNLFYGKHPDRPRKKLNPKDPIDRQLSIEWCQIAETAISQQK